MNDCTSFLEEAMLAKAWTNCMTPQQAIAYGQELLDISSSTEIRASAKIGIFKKLLGFKGQPKISIDEQRDILAAAGRWYIFWGERGHPIAAWF